MFSSGKTKGMHVNSTSIKSRATRTVIALWTVTAPSGPTIYTFTDATTEDGRCGYCVRRGELDRCPGLLVHLRDHREHARGLLGPRVQAVEIGLFDVPTAADAVATMQLLNDQLALVAGRRMQLLAPLPTRPVVVVWREQAGRLIGVEYVSGSGHYDRDMVCDCIGADHLWGTGCPLDQAERMRIAHAADVARCPELGLEHVDALTLLLPVDLIDQEEVFQEVMRRLVGLGLVVDRIERVG